MIQKISFKGTITPLDSLKTEYPERAKKIEEFADKFESSTKDQNFNMDVFPDPDDAGKILFKTKMEGYRHTAEMSIENKDELFTDDSILLKSELLVRAITNLRREY
jgi:hypothetical protein